MQVRAAPTIGASQMYAIPSGKSAANFAAAASARRVLPVPPGPVRVTRRALSRSVSPLASRRQIANSPHSSRCFPWANSTPEGDPHELRRQDPDLSRLQQPVHLHRGGAGVLRAEGLRLCAQALLVVPGGAAFADAVREHDGRFALRATTSHRMAILAMEQFGWLLSDLISGAERCARLELRLGAWLSGRASPSHGGGHWFESSTAHHPKR